LKRRREDKELFSKNKIKDRMIAISGFHKFLPPLCQTNGFQTLNELAKFEIRNS
jgi:hypothetical protein